MAPTSTRHPPPESDGLRLKLPLVWLLHTGGVALAAGRRVCGLSNLSVLSGLNVVRTMTADIPWPVTRTGWLGSTVEQQCALGFGHRVSVPGQAVLHRCRRTIGAAAIPSGSRAGAAGRCEGGGPGNGLRGPGRR
jgi:hypothetical protein